VAPATPTERKAWSEQRDERELIEHFRFVEGVSPERAGMEFHARCQSDSGYLDWLKADLEYSHAITGVLDHGDMPQRLKRGRGRPEVGSPEWYTRRRNAQ
jgi:hypothetical protein